MVAATNSTSLGLSRSRETSVSSYQHQPTHGRPLVQRNPYEAAMKMESFVDTHSTQGHTAGYSVLDNKVQRTSLFRLGHRHSMSPSSPQVL